MRACVLGAAGTIGPAIARDLAASEEVEDLLLLDLDGGRAAAVAEGIGYGTVRAAAADASDPAALAKSLDGADVVINSASYRLNLKVMEACVRACAHYLDLGGLYRITAKQLETFAPRDGADRFEAAGLLAVLGIGSSPGKTNLMAVQATRELKAADPGTPAAGSAGLPLASGSLAEDGAGIDSIHVSAAGRDMSPPEGFSIPYALQTLIDELTLPPVVIRGGEQVEIEPLSPGGSVDFGEPIGEAETIHTLHSEMLTFPGSFGCRDGSFRLSLHADLVERLRELTTASPEEIAAAAREAVPPSNDTVSVHVIEAARGERAVRVRAVTRPVEELACGGGVASTAAPAAAAVRLLARGDIAARGVHPPEACIDPEAMFAELRLRGCEFDVSMSETQEVAR
jgi:saccharopine dehydrogenase (NAD+, L-lysine-forming)